MLDKVTKALEEAQRSIMDAQKASPGPNRTAIDHTLMALRHQQTALETLRDTVQKLVDGDFG
jgi:hypothetical protein